MSQVIRSSVTVFAILLVVTAVTMLLFGSVMFYAERGTWNPATGRYERNTLLLNQPNEISPYSSIPLTFWWCCVTLTTTGYGDMTPTSNIGFMIGVVAMYCGVLFTAMPVAILGANFTDRFLKMEEAKHREDEQREQQFSKLISLLTIRNVPIRTAFSRWRKWAVELHRREHDISSVIERTIHRFVRDAERRNNGASTPAITPPLLIPHHPLPSHAPEISNQEELVTLIRMMQNEISQLRLEVKELRCLPTS